MATRIVAVATDADRDTLRTSATEAVTDLKTIQSTAFANNNQRDAAIKKEAQILEKLVKVVARLILQ